MGPTCPAAPADLPGAGCWRTNPDEAALDQALQERDDAQEWADRLAYSIASMEVIGEHTSLNNPWQNAFDFAARAPERDGLAERVVAAPEEMIDGEGDAWDALHGDTDIICTCDGCNYYSPTYDDQRECSLNTHIEGIVAARLAEIVANLLGTPAPSPARCPECMGVGDVHNLVHVRHPTGGGGSNLLCSRLTTPAPEEDR